mmetsp:Transcript_10512/g.24437  ORF Transcript_10512/g.24437 Transcript_10512/m.24437 type:complete len:651 (-) Transcript_10512:348-2300(-)
MFGAPQPVPCGHKSTIVIGGGIGSCFVAKELHQYGNDFLAFDMMPRPGGVYVRYSYPDMHFTTSTQTAAFGDFPWNDKPAHWSIEEFVEYLDKYVDHFGFRDKLMMNAKVETARRLEGGKWEVTVHYKKWHEHFSHEGAPALVKEKWEVYTCDHVVIASGTHNAWKYPDYPGLADFKGKYYHSSMFHDVKKELQGKELLLIGTGESGCDLANLAAKVCKKVNVSVRQHSGTYFPREFESVPADTVDCRAIYMSPRKATHAVIRKTFVDRFLNHTYDKPLFEIAAKANQESDRTPMNSYGVKTFDMFDAMVKHDVSLVTGVKAFDGKKVELTDGTLMEPDAVMFSTGYMLRFPYFEEHEKEIACRLQDIRSLWKHAVVPEMGDKLFVIGFARPNMTSLFIPAELQARLVAGAICKTVKLPPVPSMVAQAREDAAWYKETFSEHTTSRLKALVDWTKYDDEMAEVLGASPPLVGSLLRGDVELFVHLFFGSINAAQFRFSGPNSDYAKARAACVAIPLHRNYLRACVRPHLIAVNVVFILGCVLGVFHRQCTMVGRMRHASPIFYSVLGLATAARLMIGGAVFSAPFSAEAPLVVLSALLDTFKYLVLSLVVLMNSLVAAAWYYSPKSNPPGMKQKDAEKIPYGITTEGKSW